MAAMARKARKQISNSERHGESSSPSNIDIDRLAQLPDELRIDIIRLLPTEEAVRTGVLNKSWRNLWQQIHNINFSSQKTRQASLRKELGAFDDFLGNFHPSTTINKFSLQFHCSPVGSQDKLDSCLSWAVERPVKMLALDVKIPAHTSRRLYQVPAVLFQCQSLVELKLGNVATLNMHIRTASWPKLKVLNLTGMRFNVMEFNNLMESCPLLERLSLVRCKFWCQTGESSQIRICSTTLRCLKLWKCLIVCFAGFCFDVLLNLPSLVKCSIDMDMGHDGPAKGKVRALLDAVPHVEELHVGQSLMLAMRKDGIRKSETVKRVQVEITNYNREHLQRMPYLISSYSKLQTWVVNFNDIHSTRIRNFQQVLDGGKVLEDCLSGMLDLKTIHVCGIKASEVKELIEDTNKDQIESSDEFSRKMKFNEFSRKMKFKIVRILLKKFTHLEEMWIYVASEDCYYFGSESVLMEETRKLFEEASGRPTLQVTCKPYDSPDWLAMSEN